MVTYSYIDDLKNGTTFESSPVRVTKKRAKKRENVDSARPYAHIIRSFSIVLLQHSC